MKMEPGAQNEDRARGAVRVPVCRRDALALCAVSLLGLTGCGTAKPSAQSKKSEDSAPVLHEKSASEQVSEPDRWGEETVSRVTSLTDPHGASVSVAAVPLDRTTLAPGSGAIEISADTRRKSASIIKLFILACALDEIAEGSLSLDETLVMTATNIVGGSGVIAGRGAGTAFSIDELLLQMISQSDNTAANMLIDRLGFEAVNAEAAKLGCPQTSLARKMMDTAAQARGVDNFTSANDAATVLQKIAAGGIATPDLCARAREYLLAQTDARGIVEGVPAGISVAHKTGTLSDAQHDAAIVYAEQPFILVVLTEGLAREDALSLERDIAAALTLA